jgi:hypothetical protein
LNEGLTHSGDPGLARQIDCVLRVDARGSRLAKETRNSPRTIDLAVAAVMALDRAATRTGNRAGGAAGGLAVTRGFIDRARQESHGASPRTGRRGSFTH